MVDASQGLEPLLYLCCLIIQISKFFNCKIWGDVISQPLSNIKYCVEPKTVSYLRVRFELSPGGGYLGEVIAVGHDVAVRHLVPGEAPGPGGRGPL